jgi:hypothetical protein
MTKFPVSAYELPKLNMALYGGHFVQYVRLIKEMKRTKQQGRNISIEAEEAVKRNKIDIEQSDLKLIYIHTVE